MNVQPIATLPVRVLEPDGELFGGSPAMARVHKQIAQVARSSATVLILGETGTGKELAARTIRRLSSRSAAPMVVVNCGALPDQLLESELFGFEPGAFTGATQRRRGKAELAAGGTLFLDEIGELSLAGQVKLLRLLQERSLERLGGEHTIHVDIRVIAATHIDLAQAVAKKRFREDLYYRLNVFPINLPPLRERPADVGLLAHRFLGQFAAKHCKEVKGFSEAALQALEGYDWPGNVRELQNILERAVLVAERDCIQAADLCFPHRPLMPASDSPNLRDRSEDLERCMLEEALRSTSGSKTGSARLLGISERMVRYKIIKYGIDSRGLQEPRSTWRQ